LLADLPPSPRSRRQQSYQDRGAKYAADANTAKVLTNSAIVRTLILSAVKDLLHVVL